jgi:hypothetical protein
MTNNTEQEQSISPMAACTHPWREIQSVHEYGELYEQCRLCDHVITSRLLDKAVQEAVASTLTELEALLPDKKEAVNEYGEVLFGHTSTQEGYNQAISEVHALLTTFKERYKVK